VLIEKPLLQAKAAPGQLLSLRQGYIVGGLHGDFCFLCWRLSHNDRDCWPTSCVLRRSDVLRYRNLNKRSGECTMIYIGVEMRLSQLACRMSTAHEVNTTMVEA
jgi:hypothetical protein